MELNIIQLIENNPITKLSKNYEGILINKIKNVFNDFEQQLFVTSFYCYLNYNIKTDFVVDLDNIWKWIGFSVKIKAKILLEKNFIENIDYKIIHDKEINKKGSGGHNKETIMLTIKTFKLLCIKASTKKADEIHEYFIKLEEILQEVIAEESNDLKKELENKNNELLYQKKLSELEKSQLLKEQKELLEIEKDKLLKEQKELADQEKYKLLEKTLIEQFPLNTQCIYYGTIDNKTLGKAPRLNNEDLIKFGQSNNLADRIKCHKKNFKNFQLVHAFNVKNKIEIENAIKQDLILSTRIRSIQVVNANYKEENYRELLALDNEKFTLEKIHEHISRIIKDTEYNIENYNKVIEKNIELKDYILKLEKDNKEKDEQISKFKLQLDNYKSDITTYTKNKTGSEFSSPKCGFYLYAFEYENMRYKCSIVRESSLDQLIDNLKKIDNNGEMKYYTKISYPFTEKIMIFMLKKSLCFLGNHKFEGSFDEVKKILDITVKIENTLNDNAKDLEKLSNILDGNLMITKEMVEEPEIPIVRKAKRPVDQIDPLTNTVIASFESIEAAGRAIGANCTTNGVESKKCGTKIGVALRNKTISSGFLWRYSGISKEDQYNDQPVIKICCKNGEKNYFKTIADAAKDSNISAPGLRNRILTNVHINDNHWIFDKTSTHYT